MMEAKFVFVILCVEAAALYFNIHHLQTNELDVYNNFDETPTNITYSNINFTCFKKINHCHYESHRVRPIIIIHCALIVVGIAAYISVLVCLIRAYYLRRTNPKHIASSYPKSRLYKSAEILILFVTGANTILLGLQYHYDSEMMATCSKVSDFIRIENLTTFILINAMECSYIFFDLVFHDENNDQVNERIPLTNNEHRVAAVEAHQT